MSVSLSAKPTSFTSPYALTIAEAVQFSRIGRTRMFEIIAAGNITAIKAGKRTLVLTESLRSYLDNLPRAGEAA